MTTRGGGARSRTRIAMAVSSSLCLGPVSPVHCFSSSTTTSDDLPSFLSALLPLSLPPSPHGVVVGRLSLLSLAVPAQSGVLRHPTISPAPHPGRLLYSYSVPPPTQQIHELSHDYDTHDLLSIISSCLRRRRRPLPPRPPRPALPPMAPSMSPATSKSVPISLSLFSIYHAQQ